MQSIVSPHITVGQTHTSANPLPLPSAKIPLHGRPTGRKAWPRPSIATSPRRPGPPVPPQKKVAFTQPDATPVRGNNAPESPFGLLAATCPSHHRPMPMSPPPHAYLTTATCLSHRSHMPISPPPHAHLTAATCPSHHRHMPMSPPPHAYLTSATCPSHLRHMPISLLPHAYVALARCLCHFGEMPMSPPATCLCRQSEMPMSPK